MESDLVLDTKIRKLLLETFQRVTPSPEVWERILAQIREPQLAPVKVDVRSN